VGRINVWKFCKKENTLKVLMFGKKIFDWKRGLESSPLLCSFKSIYVKILVDLLVGF